MKLGKLDLKTILPRLKRLKKLAEQHAVFIAVLAVLLAYLFVVWKINNLANAEPSQAAQNAALVKTKIPKVDKDAIEQIQKLEGSNVEVHSLFNQARTNPFQE